MCGNYYAHSIKNHLRPQTTLILKQDMGTNFVAIAQGTLADGCTDPMPRPQCVRV